MLSDAVYPQYARCECELSCWDPPTLGGCGSGVRAGHLQTGSLAVQSLDGCSECYSEASDHEEAETTDIPPPPPPYSEQTPQDPVDASGPPGSTRQGTLPPPYSSAASSEANGSLSSPVSTMTSQSSASSLTKQRPSWLDLVSHASPAAGETAVLCSAQVHLHQCPQEETAEAARLATQDWRSVQGVPRLSPYVSWTALLAGQAQA